MKVVAYVAILLPLFHSECLGHSLHNNHKYEDQATNQWPDVPRGFSKVQEEAMRERQEQLVRFVSDFTTASSSTVVPDIRASNLTNVKPNHRYNPTRPYRKVQRASFRSPRPHRTSDPDDLNFIPKDEIRPGDVVGLIPTEMFKVSHTEAPATSESILPNDSETGESQQIPVYEESPWSSSQFKPERIANHRFVEPYKAHNLYEKPYGRVKVHTYRGRPKDYWVLPLHSKPEHKTYAQWGYYVKQPVGSEHDKFHSALDLSFRYD